MKTHYLLLSDPLVPPALDGRKTQTRRVVSWHNSYVDGVISKYWRLHWQYLDFSRAWLDKGPSPAGNPGPYLHVPRRVTDPEDETVHRIYPRYTPGDRLIFKETCALIPHGPDTDGLYDPPEVLYRSDGDILPKGMKWRASMLMPAAAARSINRIIDVRCQRVQEITEEDAREEGIRLEWRDVDGNPIYGSCGEMGFGHKEQAGTAREAFGKLWNKINAKRGFPHESNPWTWPLTFERIKEAS